MAQQTAVEWLASELKNHCDMPHKHFDEILEQAKQMEKKQMHKVASFWRGKENEIEKPIFQQCYNETFKN